ncbi:MAG: V-type ATP synthase subunit A [Gemmatimonadaceae bacterium]
MTAAPVPTPAPGTVVRVSGPLVEVQGLPAVTMFDLVRIGASDLPGEVIDIDKDVATVQVYEYTGGLRPGDIAISTGGPLSAELGPGLLGGVYDGLLRVLQRAGDRLTPGAATTGLPRDQRWHFSPVVKKGDSVRRSAPLGDLSPSRGTSAVALKALTPASVEGTVDWIADAGDRYLDDKIAVVSGHDVSLVTSWPVRVPRPAAGRLPANAPLLTGQRVLDFLFPIAKGSTASIPGGFGTGKTMALQQIAKWCDADVVVYVGCGERGNEMADVATDLGRLTDPRTGRPLLDRVVLIANTSNMPVMAREASIYVGVTIAEYFRDMGLDAIVIADSTSRWAEALREISSRMRQLPAEQGFPANLASALAAFYERAGRFTLAAGGEGTVSILGAVSPPGGDMTEPVTAHTRRFVRAVWSLDRSLAYARHYPAVSWRESFARDADAIADWHAAKDDPAWRARREGCLGLLGEADRLEAVAELVGASALPDRERLVLLVARLLREGVMQQNALLENDATSSLAKTAALVQLVLDVYDTGLKLLDRHVPVSVIEEADLSAAFRARMTALPDGADQVTAIRNSVIETLEALT